MNSKRNKGNDDNQIIDDIFKDIKQKLEEDYSLSSTGWSDEELKNKIKGFLNNKTQEGFTKIMQFGLSSLGNKN